MKGRDFRLYHIHEGEEPVEIPIETVGTVDSETGLEVVSGFEFNTDGFSEFVLQYTVDFHYEINGKRYEFSIPGGGFVSLEHLVEVLGLASLDENTANGAGKAENGSGNGAESAGKVPGTEDAGAYEQAIKLNEVKVSEATKQFVADVESVEFSSPELVWVGKAVEATTVGGLKEGNGLTVEYSTDLTEAQIAEIIAQPVEAGDWVLISLKPFLSDERLTVTMKNGDSFIVRVTDAQLRKTVITAEGETFRITVTYGEDAQIPEGAELEAAEITEGEVYEELSRQAHTLLEASDFSFIRIFDIGIVYKGEKVEPAANVEVSIEYIHGDQPEEEEPLSVVHFAEEGPEILSADMDTKEEGVVEVSFSTESFSPFATISERIDNADITNSIIAYFNFDQLDKINGRDGFISTVNGNIVYAKPIASGAKPDLSPAYDGSMLKLDNSNDDALSVTKADGSSLMTGLNEATISYWEYTSDNRTSWAYYAAPPGNQPMQGGERYIGAFHKVENNEGKLIEERYNNGRGGGNYQIQTPASKGAWHYVTVVYGADTTTVYVDGIAKETKSGQPSLNNILGNNSIFQIGKANWGGGEYFTGYLDEMMVLNCALTPAEVASLYNSGYAQGGAPAKQNKISITDLINYTLANGVDTVTSGNVPSGSYRTTRPGKVLSDVIFYTTEYDHDVYNYDYYAVTHDGGLVKVTDLGSEIMWKDPREIKWDLIVYTNTITSEDGVEQVIPSGYYELAYKDENGTTHFLSPQLNTDSFIQNDPLGLQFAGPVEETYGTTIEAWDADDHEQVGLKIQGETLIGAAGRESEEFFFARNTEEVNYTNPRQVATIDSAAKGIQIKLFDYKGGENGSRPGWMENLIGDDPYRSGHQVTLDLVKHNLNGGIPVASLTGNTLNELFSGSGSNVDAYAANVNHLFLQGTYDETGYFSYNSAQNYAQYNNGNFIVYDQAAAPNGNGTANYHGNFFPYNTFGEASNSQYMWYDVNDALLTPDDPEYNTRLRSLANINYTFGMEIVSDFYMSKEGRDERGREIVYEFNGDDDLWVFIDDKLALDIGGVHGAIHGTINFTTGEIIVASEKKYSVTGETSPKNTEVAGSVTTSLAEQFRKAYKEQGKSDAEITALLDETFNKDNNGNYTSFKPYTMHNMKMFYMESGMGASNLNVRFNLPVIPPASFAIEKDLPEDVQSKYTDRRFAFKVYVEDEYNSDHYVQIMQNQVGEGKLVTKAVYEGTTTPATFDDGILYLRPDEAIQLSIGDERLRYYVEEIEIDPDMWREVDINNAQATMVLDGTDHTGHVRSDYQPVSQRARVVFDNVPKNTQKLLINKFVESTDPQSANPNVGFEFYVYLEGHKGNLEPYSVGGYYLTKTSNGEKHYFNNSYNDLGTEPQICSYSGPYGTIGNVRAGYTIEIPGLLPGTDFYVVERMDNIPDGYIFDRKILEAGTYDEKDNDIYLIRDGERIDPDGKIKANADAKVTIYNRDIVVYLIKVDATDMETPLQNAQFTLKKLNPEGYGTYPSNQSEQVEKVSTVTDIAGKYYIAGIKNGYYEISETGVPAGYILVDDGKFYIKVQNGTITLLTKDTEKKVKEWSERILTNQDKLSFDDDTFTFTVGNTPGASLPSTGGPGTTLIYILGSILILGAGILLWRRRRMT